jgi:hypothetical protein
LGEAGGFVIAKTAVARGQDDERGRMGGIADAFGDLGGGGGDRVAVFIFEFENAFVAVAGEMENVIAEFAEGEADLRGAAGFEDADVGVAEVAGFFDGVEDGVEFALDIED